MSVIAACLPILGPVFFKNKRGTVLAPTKSSAFSSYFRKATSGNPSRRLGGKYSRAIDSIDRLKTQGESVSMKSLVPGESENDHTLRGIPAIHVQKEFAVRGENIAS
jgi:hypothetical protein